MHSSQLGLYAFRLILNGVSTILGLGIFKSSSLVKRFLGLRIFGAWKIFVRRWGVAIAGFKIFQPSEDFWGWDAEICDRRFEATRSWGF